MINIIATTTYIIYKRKKYINYPKQRKKQKNKKKKSVSLHLISTHKTERRYKMSKIIVKVLDILIKAITIGNATVTAVKSVKSAIENVEETTVTDSTSKSDSTNVE